MSQPEPPASLPKYLAEGIPKQKVETLRDVRKYVDALIEYREQPVKADELPDSVEPVDRDDGGMGTVVKEKVKCGDETCKCASGNLGDMHGPYLYRYYREGGKLTSEYLGKP
ncbi:DUF6788 family protein [Halorubrum distributum]|uniref:DUF6788 family protein n=1 Tax=Halorubrum distributum TaxID=29283 RepID=UPI002954DDF6|nr:DUF6788 family protein [Halorubrum distributum]MDV7351235.1 DUF6788 family protein [Halorubrum distributum]